MTDIPVIKTDRLVLRGPVEADFAAYEAFYASDAARYIGGPLDTEASWRSFASDAGHWVLKGYGWWTITRDNAVVGCLGLHFPPHHADLEIGWNVYTPGGGIGTEAARAVLSWAASEMNSDRLVSYIDRDNAASIALAKKLGATREADASAHDPKSAVYLHNLEGYRV